MKKTALTLILTASMIGGVTTAASAAPITSDKTANSAVEAQQKAYNDAQAQLEAAQTNLEQISNEISNLTREINENNVQITDNEQKLQVFTQEYNKDLQVEAERIKAIYQNNNNMNFVNLLLTSQNIGDFISKYFAVSKIMQLDSQAVQNTQAAKNSIATTNANLNNLKASNEAKLAQLNDKKVAAQKLVEETQNNSAVQAQKLAQAKANAAATINLLKTATTAAQVNNAVTALKHIASSTPDSSVQQEVTKALSNNQDKISKASTAKAPTETVAPTPSPAPAKQVSAAPAPTQSTSSSTSSSSNSNSSSSSNSSNSSSQKAPAQPSSSQGSAQAQQIISYAMTFLGDPYVWGAKGPNEFDCSGLTSYVYNHFGYGIGDSTYTQIDEGTPVSTNNLQPGDLIFWGNPSAPYHVAIYIGGGEYIQAPRPGSNVDISSWNLSGISAARRIL